MMEGGEEKAYTVCLRECRNTRKKGTFFLRSTDFTVPSIVSSCSIKVQN